MGSTRIGHSPLTGQIVTYHQTLQNYVFDHQATPPDRGAIINQINTDLASQGIDAYCDGITMVQGAITDTLQSSVWIASQSPIPIAVALAVMKIVMWAIALFIVITLYYVITALKELIWGVPQQYYIPDYPTGPVSWSEYISYQNANFWYVCSKDGAGFGSKARYPNIEDVPQAEVNAYREHCATAPDISPGEGQLISIAIVVGGVILIVGGIWLVGKLFGRK